jgi:hypothetical protein
VALHIYSNERYKVLTYPLSFWGYEIDI